jgi:tRNA nucleotidyltransferase/poly(A) polymerase
VDEVGRQFGVLKVGHPGEEALDVAVPRRDNKIGAGHRGFTVDTGGSMSVYEAASRRDFTINAIYYDPCAGVVMDPFGGVADLNSRVLRHVSDSFSDDPLRVLRGVQFAGRFAMEFHPDTAALCRQLRPHFVELATERVQLEWAKIYTSRHPEMAAAALQTTGWDDVLPGMKSALAQTRIAAALTRLPAVPVHERVAIGAAVIASTMSLDDRNVFLAATVVGKDAAILAEDLAATDPGALAASCARKNHAHTLAKRGFTYARYREYAQTLGDSAALVVAQAAMAEGLGDGPEPAWIQGRDVVAAAAGCKPGPWVGELVAVALDRQYRGEFSGRGQALNWLDSAVAEREQKP